MRALAVIVAIEVAVLVIAVGAFLHGERRVTFPAAMASSPPELAARASVPVSISVRAAVGSTSVTARFARGGQAVAVRSRADRTPCREPSSRGAGRRAGGRPHPAAVSPRCSRWGT